MLLLEAFLIKYFDGKNYVAVRGAKVQGSVLSHLLHNL